MAVNKTIHQTLTGLLLMMVAIMPLINSNAALDPVLPARTIFISVFLLAMFSLILINSKDKTFIISNEARVFIAFYLTYLLFSAISIINAINLGEALWDWSRSLLYFGLFLVSMFIFQQNKGVTRILLPAFLVYSAVIAGSGIFQLFNLTGEILFDHQASYLVRSVLAHRNMFSEMLLLTLPLLISGAYLHKGWLRFMFYLLFGISVFLITILLVRSVWVALLVQLIVLISAGLIWSKSLEINAGLRKKISFLIAGGVIVVVLAVAVYSRMSDLITLKKQTDITENYNYGSALERVILWEKSFEMFLDHPLTGVGTGNWKILLPAYGTDRLRSADGVVIFQRPHNDFIWVLAENGLFGFLAYLSFFVWAVIAIIKTIRTSPDLASRRLAMMLLVLLAGYLVIATFSFPKERPDQSVFLAIAFGLIFSRSGEMAENPVHRRSAVKGLLLLLPFIVLTGYIGTIRLRSEIHTRKAFIHRSKSEWNKMISEVQEAEGFFSRLDPTSTPLRWYSGLGWYNIGNQEKALADFKAAYRANPNHLHTINNLATSYGFAGELQSAINLYKKAAKISPDFTDASMNLAVIYFLSEKQDSCYLVLRKIQNAQSHPHYRNLIAQLTYKRVETLRRKIDDHDLNITLQRIRNSEDWMVKVFEQAIADSIELERRLVIESIYMLEKVDQSISTERAELLRNKYLSQPN